MTTLIERLIRRQRHSLGCEPHPHRAHEDVRSTKPHSSANAAGACAGRIAGKAARCVSTIVNFATLPIEVYRRLVAVTPERGARRGNLRARGCRERRNGNQREQCESSHQLLHDTSPGYGRSSVVFYKQREAGGQRCAVTSSRAQALIDTGEMGPPPAKGVRNRTSY